MYNYYTDLKLKAEKKEKEKNLRKQKEQNDYRKILNDQLVNNYNDRVYKFILDLAQNPDSRVKLQDSSNKIENTRLEIFKENFSKLPKGNNSFSFGTFMTDKERIQKFLEEKKYEYEQFRLLEEEKMKKKKEKEEKDFKNKEAKQLNQAMRFKPRNDLERIMDIINNYNYGYKDPNSRSRSLRKKSKSIKKNPNTEGENEEEEEEEEEEEKEIEKELLKKKDSIVIEEGNKFLNREKERIRKIQKEKSKLKEIIKKNFGYKTYFRGAYQVGQDKKFNGEGGNENNKRLFDFGAILKGAGEKKKKERIRFENKNIYAKTPKEKFSHTYGGSFGNFHKSKSMKNIKPTPLKEIKDIQELVDIQMGKSLLSSCVKNFPVEEENFDVLKNNALLYALDEITNTEKVKASPFDKDKKAYLRKLIAMRTGPLILDRYKKYVEKVAKYAHKNGFLFGESIGNFGIKKKDDGIRFTGSKLTNIRIDDQVFPVTKKKVIIDKMLRKYNYIHPKSVFSKGSLEKGEGKLMFTSGMTINDFEDLYNFK